MTGQRCLALASLDELIAHRDEARGCTLAILDINLGPGSRAASTPTLAHRRALRWTCRLPHRPRAQPSAGRTARRCTRRRARLPEADRHPRACASGASCADERDRVSEPVDPTRARVAWRGALLAAARQRCSARRSSSSWCGDVPGIALAADHRRRDGLALLVLLLLGRHRPAPPRSRSSSAPRASSPCCGLTTPRMGAARHTGRPFRWANKLGAHCQPPDPRDEPSAVRQIVAYAAAPRGRAVRPVGGAPSWRAASR